MDTATGQPLGWGLFLPPKCPGARDTEQCWLSEDKGTRSLLRPGPRPLSRTVPPPGKANVVA